MTNLCWDASKIIAAPIVKMGTKVLHKVSKLTARHSYVLRRPGVVVAKHTLGWSSAIVCVGTGADLVVKAATKAVAAPTPLFIPGVFVPVPEPSSFLILAGAILTLYLIRKYSNV